MQSAREDITKIGAYYLIQWEWKMELFIRDWILSKSMWHPPMSNRKEKQFWPN